MPPSHESDSDKPTHSPEPPQSPSQIISSEISSDESSIKSDLISKSIGEVVKEEEEEEEVCGVTVSPKRDGTVEDQMSSGRERLKRHRVEVAGRVWIPDMWGQEDLLKDWIDCAAFDASLVNSRIMLARDSLIGEARRSANSTALRISHGC